MSVHSARWSILGMSLLLGTVRAAIRLLGFARTVRLLNRFVRPYGRENSHDIVATARRVNTANGRPIAGTCLDRSVLVWFLGRRSGLDARLRIGVSMTDGDLDAHAWVEVDGVVVNDDPDVASRFAVFAGDATDLVFR